MGDSVTAEISAGLSDEKLAHPKQATDLVKRACVSGSTFGGSCLKIGWVGLGLHLEFHAGDQWIITSHVHAIGVEPSATGRPC